jgi:hypothetical protein
MDSTTFLGIVANDKFIQPIVNKYPESIKDVEKFTTQKWVKLLLFKAGEIVVQILLGILESKLKKKYEI